MMELRASLILTKSDTLSLSHTLSPCCSEYLSIFSACVSAHHMHIVLVEAEWAFGNRSCKWLSASMWVLGIQYRFSVLAASTLDP